LRGILQKLDYLLDLGINAIYLNPIFLSPSNHRYNTTDYLKIDPILGDEKDFKSLLDTAHANGVRIVLDGVFNHCGRGFFAFHDILENNEDSPYLKWFHIKKLPLDAYSPGKAKNYLAWWGIKSLPKFNTDTPAVRRYLLDVARYWLDEGIDGWRLDVPNEIDDDDFWAEFRSVVRTVNPDAYLLGEIWTIDKRWVGDGHFDGLMNYPLREVILRLLTDHTYRITEFAALLDNLTKVYPRENAQAMYLLLGSHDTERVMTMLGGDLQRVKLAFLFLFAFPGAPAVYYGDEIGVTGGKDPDNRAAFPWETSNWNIELRDWIKKLITQRKNSIVLRRGDYQQVVTDVENSCYAFVRTLEDKHVLCIFNFSTEGRWIDLPVPNIGWVDGSLLHNLVGQEEYILSGGQLSIYLAPWEGAWIG
jgi:glycosidase